ncbi:MAG: hypothetical protein JWO05_1264 [Gemmatimonadetes bacterium]|nr:hypothetical protein [Gemmatimonadota bacterium]
MSVAPFTTQLRTRGDAVKLGEGGLRFRVEMMEKWDTVMVDAPASESLLAVKVKALQALLPEAEYPEEFVLKLGGWDMLDEGASLEGAGVKQGSILLLTHRRRRPVR